MNYTHETDSILTDAAVERIDDRTVRICWESLQDAEVTVYESVSPDAFDRARLAGASDDGCMVVDGLDPAFRHYFFLQADADILVTSERRVCMDGTVNFRDIGGYKTVDGRSVGWGRVFRADGLSRLSDRDMGRIRNMGIRRVYDFRTISEIEGSPDRLPEDGSLDHIHLPVSHGRFDFAEAVRRLKNGDKEWLTHDFMVKGYIRNLEKYPETWGAVIRDVSGAHREPIVFHCTGGKDRTGTCAALILLALGVPEETVIDDHQLSNIYIARLLPRLYRQMEKEGIDPDALFPYLTAPRECILAVVDNITRNYGTAEDYLIKKAGMKAGELKRLKQNLLE